MAGRFSWVGEERGAELARWLRASQAGPGPHDLVILCCGHTLPAHRAVIAAASPLLASLLREHQTGGEEAAELCWPDLSPGQAVLVLQFIYCGQVEGLDVTAAGELVEAAGHLQVTGLLPGRASLVASIASLEDDVFIGPSGEREEEDIAVDLSPVNRHPPEPSSSLLAPRNLVTSSRISQTIRTSGSMKHSSFGDTMGIQSQEEILHRIKKPQPLTDLPVAGEAGAGLYLKPRTPRTPLLASPDCYVLEEKFRHLIEGKESESDKLRNLSVSSADFNYDPSSGSVPGTPNSGPRHRTFHFPERETASATDSSLDLSMRRLCSSPSLTIPTIHVVKPEPEDSTEDESQHSSSSSHQHQAPLSPKSEPPERPQSGGHSFYIPVIHPLQLSPIAAPSTSPSSPSFLDPTADPLYRFMLPHKIEKTEHNSSLYSSAESPPNLLSKKQSSNPRKREMVKSEKQSFKCQKCGKSYNWNYNLNRHMRFECGIENRFECAMCHKRFPYKQNAAIHLKRKHKLGLETADDMIAAGHISLLPATGGGQ